ncbi:hypothetical protein TNIN_330911 [Trichonephila inaurata madagascariensis]|uniref:Uncharacterized protein n=1 Tax=Trichonephila inaurata madagascariensis TaxID=2747483 RepID=A0A8X6XM41_9ARAC|nr:hypothetical protein TNIN_330911 [Trichonephila inaurata madagascariensis]
MGDPVNTGVSRKRKNGIKELVSSYSKTWRSKTSLVSVLYSMLQLASKATDTSQSREKLKVQKRKREDDEEEKVGMATHSSDL